MTRLQRMYALRWGRESSVWQSWLSGLAGYLCRCDREWIDAARQRKENP